jgi:hypothetical protein
MRWSASQFLCGVQSKGDFMSRLGVFAKHFAKTAQFCIAALLAPAFFPGPAHSQTINFGSAVQLIDNDANQGSPTIIVFNNSLVMYYVNHSNNTIYVDFGLTGNPSSTGIVVNSTELTDVGVCVLNGKVLLTFVSPGNPAYQLFTLSTDGVHFGIAYSPGNSGLGLGNQNPDSAFVSALTSDGATAYVATVGANHSVYIAYTTDGTTYQPLVGNGISVSGNTATSRPSLTMYNGSPWVGFTSNTPGTRRAVVGIASGTNAPAVGGTISWGNSNRDGNYAGLGLLSYNGILYAFGQDTASSQYLKYIFSNGGTSWSGPYWPGNQMRWTPSLVVFGSTVYLTYQDDANTNISYRHN